MTAAGTAAAVGSILIADARSALVREVGRLQGRGDLDEFFAAWLASGTGITFDLSGPLAVTAGRSEGARGYRDVAALGFAAALAPEARAIHDPLMAGLNWLAGREPTVNGFPAGFCSDGVALLGVALGAVTLGDAETARRVELWMGRFVGGVGAPRAAQSWERWLSVAAAGLVGIAVQPVACDSASADVRVALRARGALPGVGHAEAERDEQATLEFVRDPTRPAEGVRAAARLAALQWVLRSAPLVDPARPTMEGVVNLLRRLPAGLRRWTWESKAKTSGQGAEARRWHIDNEYHVQNLLWMVLAPVFPDLMDEVYLQPFGQLHPRADLCVPSLKLVIEVKFIRANKSFAKIIEEVAADSAVYLSKPDSYRYILPVVWDDAQRNHEHDLAMQGLRQIPGVVDAIIISRPGSFADPSGPVQPKAGPLAEH